ncbi:MAG: hypothetical protein WA234_01535 [Rectinemataceae bacterium]
MSIKFISPPAELLVINGIYIVIFTGRGLLFRRASGVKWAQ